MKFLPAPNKNFLTVMAALVMLLLSIQAKANCNFHAQFSYAASNTNCKSINFTNTSYVSNGTDSGVSYIWRYGSSSFATTKNASYTFSGNGTYTICLIMYKQTSGGICSDTVCQSVVVNCSGCSFGNIGWNYSYNCASRTVSFTGLNSDSSGSYKYKWAFGDGTYDSSNTKSISHTYTNTGNYTVCFNIRKYDNGVLCRDTTLCKTITISSIKSVDYTATPTSNCKEFSFSIQDSNSCAVYYWFWGDNSNPSVQTNKNNSVGHTFPGNGTYQVCLKAFSCTDSSCYTYKCKTVTVNCNTCHVTANWTYNVNCPSRAVSFTTAIGDTTGNYAYHWTFGDNTSSSTKSPSHTYSNNGTYTVCLNIKRYITGSTTVCFDTTICKTITIACNTGCSAYANWSFSVACPSRTATFTSFSYDTTGYWWYYWTFGDNTTASTKNATHTYANNGTYTVCLRMKRSTSNTSSPCFDTTICKTVTVNCNTSSCPLSAGWTFNVTCPTRSVAFNASVGDTSGSYAYLWTFGDNTSSSLKSPSHTYANNGTYTVCLKVKRYIAGTTTVCRDTTICKTVTVNCSNTNTCPLYANWTYTVYCPSREVKFSTYLGDTTGSYAYYWSFGDNTSSSVRNPGHQYTHNGTYTVCLKIKRFIPGTTTVCRDTTICKTISVNCNTSCSINGGFSYGVTCPTRVVKFSAYVTDTTGYYTYHWNYGDNTTAGTTKDPAHTYASNGTYTVCLTIKRFTSNNSTTPCKDTVICKAVTINCSSCPLSAAWAYNVHCPSRNVTFTSTVADTTGYYGYYWTFGDNTTSSTKNPTHTYANNGTYTVCLHVKRYGTSNGTAIVCRDTTICKTITVNCGSCHITANFNFGVNCALRKLEVVNTSSGDSCFSYKWSWGDGTYSTAKNPGYHAYNSPGTYTVCLLIRRCADTTCATYVCKTVVIPANCCNAHAYFGASINCANRKVSVANYSYGDSCMTYKWSWGDGTYSTVKNPGYHVYNSAGTYTICLKVTKCNDSTCTTTFCKTVVIPNACCPTPNFYWYNFCNSFRFINTTTGGGTSYWWSFGDSSYSSAKNPYHAFFSKRTFTVCLTVFDSVKNCTTTVCKNVTVNCRWWGNFRSEIPGFDGTTGDAESQFEGDDDNHTDLTPSQGLQVNNQAGITAYPNPTNSLLNIVLPASNATIKITDMTGAVLMQFDNVSSFYRADVSRLAAGVYFVNVINENGLQSVRFMKN